ncbi:MAG: hypothetical protein JWO67_1400 [Streptosporangiaceae bacterium]|jgi:hypothetical protein|nr:hypothetical protein [Streptosporangiaceae bacterium]
MTTPGRPHDDLTAAFAARQELGPDYDAAFVESVVARVEETVDARMGTHLRTSSELDRRRTQADRKVTITVACVSLGVSIPLTAIAGGTAGFAGLLVAWIGLVLINLGYALWN